MALRGRSSCGCFSSKNRSPCSAQSAAESARNLCSCLSMHPVDSKISANIRSPMAGQFIVLLQLGGDRRKGEARRGQGLSLEAARAPAVASTELFGISCPLVISEHLIFPSCAGPDALQN